MKRKLTAAMIAATLMTGFGFGGTAAAQGGNGASYCSLAGPPDGEINPDDLSTWASPGEGISILSKLGVHPEGRGGWGVQGVCNPNFNPFPAD